MPRKTSNADKEPAVAAESSALTAQPETLPRAEAMAQKGYASEQLFKLALSQAGLDPRTKEIPVAALKTIPKFEAPTNGHKPQELPEAENLPPIVDEGFDGDTPVPRIVALQLIGITDDELAKELKSRKLDPKAEILDMATVSTIYEEHSLKRQEALEYLGLKEPELVEALVQIEENPKAKTLTLATIERIESLPTETLMQTKASAMRSAMDAAQERQLAYYRDTAERMAEQAETAALTLVAHSAETFHATLSQAFDALAQTQATTHEQIQSDLLNGLQSKPEKLEERQTDLGKARRSSFKGSRKTTHTRKTAQQIFQTALKR
ncbi:hypothetical protein IQ235_03935 [Oscillatoriales cyanobacterium LEGE 11467]|uniref:Uncharacterized protein n=1 Tax=Zarconia navalis LEGE 11467 TaxID=1828826 RepID=A0A928VTF4_9CYAN|nr:hypothetical protein [Zarconia navalis]MBE9039942.1 hypothetical protein [Zarconia navalis LEGE 11467]